MKMVKKHVNLSDEIIPNTDIETWVSSYDTPSRSDYGLEFLAAATYGNFADIPYSEKYILPDSARSSVEPAFGIPVIEKGSISNRLSALKRKWEKGSKPFSIRALDVLREATPPYDINLLKPVSYEGLELGVDGIPYSSSFVHALAYLSASIIAGGCIDQQGTGCIEVSQNLGAEGLYQKLRGAVTYEPDGKKELPSSFVLKQPYSRLLQLTGISRGRLVNAEKKQLDLEYLKRLNTWLEKELLSTSDRRHAIDILSKFVEGMVNHKLSISDYGTKTIRLSRFSDSDIEEYFSDLFVRFFNKVFPTINSNALPRQESQDYSGEQRTYYYTDIIIPKKYIII